MVWIEPSGSTDSTRPMWRPSQTIRSPDCGGCVPGSIALPARCAHDHTSETAPERWPWWPIGTPGLRAAHETKYEHHGPTPEPAVAWRYWAIRGESLDPGGCSATPTPWGASLTIAWPAPVPPDSGNADAPAAPAAPGAWPIKLANVAFAGVAVCGVETAVAGGAATS